MLTPLRLYTVAELEAFESLPENANRLFELVNGEIVEKAMPTELHGLIVANLIAALWLFIKQSGLGRVGVEIRSQLPADAHNARQPDISYYADTSRPIVERGAVATLPDLAVEVKSPDDTYRLMREKADYYLANGSRMVWLIYPEKRLVEAHTPDGFDLLGEADTLTGGAVLPGFALAVKDIFPAS